MSVSNLSFETKELKLMHVYFPKCPICGSEKGYVLSAFYPNVQCKVCKAEWLLYEDGMELKRASREEWDQEYLNKKYDFEFWSRLKRHVLELVEKTYAPMAYVGGHTDYRDRAFGYMVVKPDTIIFNTEGISRVEMSIEIPIRKVKGIEVKTRKEITAERWFLIGVWTVYFKKKTKYLTLTYEDSYGMLQHLVFEPEGDAKRKMNDLLSLVRSLKKHSVTAKKK